MANTVRMFSDDIRMEFGLKKCGILTLKGAMVERGEGILLPEDRKLKLVKEEGYKYLGTLYTAI